MRSVVRPRQQAGQPPRRRLACRSAPRHLQRFFDARLVHGIAHKVVHGVRVLLGLSVGCWLVAEDRRVRGEVGACFAVSRALGTSNLHQFLLRPTQERCGGRNRRTVMCSLVVLYQRQQVGNVLPRVSSTENLWLPFVLLCHRFVL